MAGAYFGSDYWRSDYFGPGEEAPAGSMACAMVASTTLTGALTNVAAAVVPPPAPSGSGTSAIATRRRRRGAIEGERRRVAAAIPGWIEAEMTANATLTGTPGGVGSMAAEIAVTSEFEATGYANRRGVITRQDNEFWLIAA